MEGRSREGSHYGEPDRKKKGFSGEPDPAWTECARFPGRGAPVGSGFGLRSLPQQDSFCRIRLDLCPCYLLERETGPVCISSVKTGTEICRFRRFWTAKLRADRTIACPIEKKACCGGRVSTGRREGLGRVCRERAWADGGEGAGMLSDQRGGECKGGENRG